MSQMSLGKRVAAVLTGAFLIVAVPFVALAQSGEWIADQRTGCKVWNANPAPDESITWSGACAKGLAQGKGVLQWYRAGRRGSTFTGEYRDGHATGRGVSVFPTGTSYDGEYRASLPNGRGVMIWSNGDRYEGQWRNGRAHGTGTYQRGSQVYQGTWSDGCFNQGGRRAGVGVDPEECFAR